MNTGEFKLEFNTYYNNVTSNQAPGYNDFEISEFLTLAYEQIVSELYENSVSGFEKTESARKSLDALLRQYVIRDVFKDPDNRFETNEFKCRTYRDEVLYVVMEWAVIGKPILDNNGDPVLNEDDEPTYDDVHTVEVIPCKYDYFLRTYKNPFRGVSKKRALRIDSKDNTAIIHTDKDYEVIEYNFEYIKKPLPIIIGNPDFEDLTINGYHCGEDIECECDESIHRMILLRAVQLAKAAWQSK
jgi:hypothetical protein